MSKIWSSLGLAVLGIAILVGAAAAESDGTTVSAELSQAYSITTEDTASITPSIGSAAESAEDTISVTSNGAWKLQVNDNAGAGINEGHMICSTPSDVATNVLYVSGDNKAHYQALTGTAADVTGASGDATGSTAASVHAFYKQTFTMDDSPGTYSITVAWTITSNV